MKVYFDIAQKDKSAEHTALTRKKSIPRIFLINYHSIIIIFFRYCGSVVKIYIDVNISLLNVR